MHWETIRKDTAPVVPPRLTDYDRTCSAFTWSQARTGLSGLPGGGLNMAHEAVDRHAASDHADKVALRCVAQDDSVSTVTYAELARRTARFANVLRSLGVGHGDRVFILLGRCPELYITVLGTLKNTGVLCPLFSVFGPDPVEQRLRLGDAQVLVTTAALYRRKVAERRASVPGLKHVLIVGAGTEDLPGTASFDDLMSAAPDTFTIPPTSPEDMALLHFTSGTTGTPKGAIHVHEAVVAHHATAAYALDLHPDDVYWCTADPGWVTGMSYGIIAPLVHGVTVVVDEGDYDARRWYRILGEQRVTVWYTAPTALRMLMRATPPPGPVRPAAFLRPVGPALHRLRRRAPQPGGRGVGPGRAGPAGARQLVADGDRLHHDRELRILRNPARLDGTSAAKAAALAAREVPELNGFWTDDHFTAGEGVHLGVAISLRGGGLVTTPTPWGRPS